MATIDGRRQAILAAATSVFLAKGYAGTNIDDVAAAARASKQTIYKYHGDKEGLFRAVIDANIADAEPGTHDPLAALRTTTDVATDLRRFARQHLADVLQPHLMQLRRLVIAEADRFPSLARTWFERGPERAHDTLAALFAELAARGVLRVDDARRAAEQFNWLVLSIPLHRALYLPAGAELGVDLDVVADDAVRVFLAAYGVGLTRSLRSPGPDTTRGKRTMIDAEVADEIVGVVREWVRREVIPRASEFEHADEYPAEWVDQMKAFGLFGARIPAEHGGLELDTLTYARLMDELAYGWMSLAGVLNTHTICANLIYRHGTEEQKARWLPGMALGEPRAAFSLSEPDAGSDAQAITCKAAKDGETYIVNGTKMWVTNGERAGLVALAARTDEGITCFIVEKSPGSSFEGIATSKRIPKLGYKGIETVEMTYTDHRVPAANVLGGVDGLGHGLHYILGSLELGRINIAARAVGVARAAFDASMKYVHERSTFGVPIHKHQAIQFKLADMATKLEASRLLVRSAAEKFEAGERADVEAGMAKLFCSETAFELATEAMRIHGGYGYTEEFPVERYFRDAPLMIIGEGTNEIQRIVIARGLLKRWTEQHPG